jgi:cytosine/adenosine deaminase-related metal-dependent hydrolase
VQRDPRVAFVEACRMLLEHNRAIAARLFRAPRGMLAPGCQADLFIADYTPFTPFDGSTFLGHLLFGLVNARVTHTICRGRVILDDGEFPHLDERALRARGVERAARLWRRIA